MSTMHAYIRRANNRYAWSLKEEEEERKKKSPIESEQN